MRTLLALVALSLAALPAAGAVQLVGEELAVKDGKPNNEHNPTVAFAEDGHGLIVWTDSLAGVRGRLVNADGSLAAGDLLLVKNLRLPSYPAEGTEILRKDPALLMGADGSFWVFWTEEVQHAKIDFFAEQRDVLDRDVYGQRFDPAGRELGVRVRINNAGSGFQSRPQAVKLACDWPVCTSERFALVWESDDLAPLSGAGEGIVGQILDFDGTPLVPQSRLSPPSPAQNVALAPGPQGGFLAAWEVPDETLPRSVLRARFFGSTLQPLAKAFLLSPKTPGIQRRVSLVWNPSAAEVTAIFDRLMPGTGRYRVVAQRVATPGQVVGEPFSVSFGHAEGPSVGVLTPAKTVLALWVSWKGRYPYFLQATELDSKSADSGDEFRVALWPRFDLAAAMAPNGRVLAVWEGWVYGLRLGIVGRWLQRTP